MGTKTILVIDDNEIILKMLEGVLNKVGYHTELAHNGREGIEMVKNKSFDLIITDVMMPYASGFEVISKLREHLEQRSVPIIVISSITQEDSGPQCGSCQGFKRFQTWGGIRFEKKEIPT